MITGITDLGTALVTALSNALIQVVAAVPHIIGFLIILIIGWIVAGLLGSAVAALLRAVKFNELADRSGISGFVKNMGVQTDAAGAFASVVRWFVRLIAMVVAFDALGLPAVSQVLQQFLLWIPNLIVALVVLVVAGLVAKGLGDLVRGATAQAKLGNPDLLANIMRIAVWGFGIVVAVNQIGIASTLVNTLFMGFVGALALAGGLAFGLGGRETAGQIVQGWYQSSQEAAPKLAQAAQAAGREAQSAAQSAKREMSDGGSARPQATTVRPQAADHYQQH